MSVRRLVIGVAIVAIAVPAAAAGTATRKPAANVQKLADLYQIDQLEVTWHRGLSKKNLDLAMSVWAPNAVVTSPGATYSGKTTLRKVFAKAGPFQPENHWISDTPAYKTRTTVNGNKGTLHFECHFIDVDTGKVVSLVGGDWDVQKINGRWLVVHATNSSPTLQP